MSSTVEIKGRVYVTPQLQTTKAGKSWCNLVIYDGYIKDNGEELENYLEIKFFGEKAERICNERKEGEHCTVKARLNGNYKVSTQGKEFYNLAIFGTEVILNEAQKPKTEKTDKRVAPEATQDEDLPF